VLDWVIEPSLPGAAQPLTYDHMKPLHGRAAGWHQSRRLRDGDSPLDRLSLEEAGGSVQVGTASPVREGRPQFANATRQVVEQRVVSFAFKGSTDQGLPTWRNNLMTWRLNRRHD